MKIIIPRIANVANAPLYKLDARAPVEQLELIYRKVELYVTVFSDDSSQQLRKLEDRANKTNGLVVGLVKENAELRERLAEVLGSVESLRERIEELEDYIEIGGLKKEAKRIAEES